MPTYVVLNPASGQGAGLRRWRRVEPLARRVWPDLDLVTADSAAALEAAVRRLARDGPATTLIAAGGDGTSHLVVNGLLDAGGIATPARMAWLPIGSGNDMARSIGVPLRGDGRIETYRHATDSAVDAGRIEYHDPAGRPAGRWFGNSFTVGISSDVLRIVTRSGKHLGGRISYFLATLRALAAQRPRDYDLTIDGAALPLDACRLLSVTNGPSFGAGMRIAPNADLTDGRFDFLAATRLSTAGTAALFPRIYWGGHLSHPAITARRITRLVLGGTGPIAFEADGELYEGCLPVAVEVVAGGLPIRRPAPESPKRLHFRG
ncbi:MAG: diacylglycerol kinase family protein [Gemmatimonadales bacterium]